MQNLKIRVNSPEESERAQRAFFALGGVMGYGQQIPSWLGLPFILLPISGIIEFCGDRHTRENGVIETDAGYPYFLNHPAKEITLQELEQLAYEAQNTGLNSFETMVEERGTVGRNTSLAMECLKGHIEAAKNSGWNKDGRDADEQLAELRGYATPADRHNETNPIIFVYQKDGTTKALSFKEAKEDAANLESDGWAHVATLDAKVFVENAYRQESEAQACFDAALRYISTESERWYDSQDNAFYPEDTSLIKAALKIAAGLDTIE